VLLASPPCIVPGLVRGLIEEAAQANLQASQRGAWRHAGAEELLDLTIELKEEFEKQAPPEQDVKQFKLQGIDVRRKSGRGER
jgi:hypothetical protein